MMIDPQHLISFHPDFPKAAYWRAYIADRKVLLQCSPSTAPNDTLIQWKKSIEVAAGETINFAEPRGAMFLATGWARPETWGVWSNDTHARLILSLTGPANSVLLKMTAFVNPRHPTQRVEVAVNGTPAGQFDLSMYNGNEARVPISEQAQRSIERLGDTSIDFNLPDAVRPAEVSSSTDARRLAIGLLRLTMSNEDVARPDPGSLPHEDLRDPPTSGTACQ